MKLNYKRTFFVGLAFMSICAFWQVYDNVIPLILKDTFHVRDSYIGIVMAMDNVLALFMLPLFGKLSDKTRTKIGRRMPYILGGTILALLCLAIMPAAQKQNNALLFFIGLGLVLIAMATYRSPAVALMPDVTPKPLRSQGNAVINYTDRETPYTRIIEHKHFEFGTQEKTVITREYPAEWTEGMEPYYPVNDERNQELYKKYAELAGKEKNVIFGGRLAEYRYYDMDKVIESALSCVKKEFGNE